MSKLSVQVAVVVCSLSGYATPVVALCPGYDLIDHHQIPDLPTNLQTLQGLVRASSGSTDLPPEITYAVVALSTGTLAVPRST